MNKFLFKSTDADLQKIYQLLGIIQKNVLYSTHQIDFIRKELMKLGHDKDLQTTVDKYYDSRGSAEADPLHPDDSSI